MQKQVIEGFQLSPQQKHLWLLQQASHNQHYRVECAIYIEGKLNKNILESALQHVVDKHEILRTNFCFLDGMKMPLQVIKESRKIKLKYRDISHLNSQEQAEKIERIIEDNGQKYLVLNPKWEDRNKDWYGDEVQYGIEAVGPNGQREIIARTNWQKW